MIREFIENREHDWLSPYAAFSSKSKGREYEIEKCDIRTEYQRDRDRILHCKSFRRLKHKTQVFIAPEGDHYRTRLTHTLEVSQIARTIARALQLNEDLTEAIAMAHDLGHTPFGHTGERCLNKLSSIGFKHNVQSLRIVEHLENGIGLNLTWEVRDGILNHTQSGKPSTLEGQVVNYADRIAYINHDIDDSIRAEIIKISDLPEFCLNKLGNTHGQRIETMVHDVVHNSLDLNKILMSEEIEYATAELRRFMFDNVYIHSIAKKESEKAFHVIEQLFLYFQSNIDQLPEEYTKQICLYGIEQTVCDYIAGMTDRYALKTYQNIFIPTSWNQC